jgi:TBC1 domain family member 5
MLDPRENLEGNNDDPLSQSQSSVWNQHFQDNELRNLIQQDVMRTNPSIPFYREDYIQNIMINVLFCYAREHPVVCYRQGMHEILAPLIFVIYGDHVCVDHITEESNTELDKDLKEMLDSKYLDADSYSLFCRVMDSLELFYRINNTNISETGQMIYNHESDNSERKRSEIEVVHQLNIIRDKIFAKQDTTLHNHLLKLEIPLAIFGM